jgi:NadR type nicotinamide-nucleotide adenylyltransferase
VAAIDESLEPDVLKVVVTGSECTGKTTLARELAAHHGTACSEEYARRYVDEHPGPLSASDVEPIACGQMLAEDAAISTARRLVILDTDLVSTVVYARHYYGACPAWVEETAQRRLGHLYLLLHPDVPWVADGPQRDRPHRREELHEAFRAALASWGASICHVRGDWEARRRVAAAAIDGLL